MASIILSDSASSFTRSTLNSIGINQIPFFGKRISSAATSFTSGILGGIGRQIDAEIFGTKTKNRIRGSRLSDLQVQSSAYGEFINQVFGTARVAGNIIWSRPIKESTNVTTVNSGGGKGGSPRPTKQTETRFSYSVSLAIAICEGVVDDVLRIWADSKLIDPANYSISYHLHKGAENQSVDSLIESFEGIGKTPAYRGTAYVVFEDFQLAEFGNRIPNFTFEVKKNYKNSFSNNSAEELLKCITLIPGCGEFVYDTVIQSKVLGTEFEGESGPDIFIQKGKQKRINRNTHKSRADVLLALDDLIKTFPNLEYVSIVCSWFGTSLTANDCLIVPGVEQNSGVTTTPSTWSVGGYNRSTAYLISRDAENRPNYGGTPSDSSILNLAAEIKSRGLKVMFYPMVFMDVPGKPWRGYITDTAANLPNFFTRSQGYNNFILHYANLLKNKVDALIIGSEFKGLTSVKDGSNNFPAVTKLVTLAASVKTIMGSATKITYAADWSEYHSANGWFNLDPLWASPNIDMIGIDAYFPLSDEPQNGNYNLSKTIAGWTNGEGYDWYYTDDTRTTKANFTATYAWKNIEYWWRHTHTNPNSIQTAWVPESKKIWFTEYGFPSTDGATNQPNVFYNPDSVDGSIPRFSKGLIDYQAQRLGIEATEVKWQSSTFIENKFLWCFDARPYPYWPDMKDVWSDGKTYQLGHWINGKFGASGLAEVLKNLAIRSGLQNAQIDTADINLNLDGFVVNSMEEVSSIISTLQDVYFFNISEVDGVLKFTPQPKEVAADIDKSELLIIDNNNLGSLLEIRTAENTIPAQYDFAYLNRNTNYLTANEHTENTASNNLAKASNKIPIVLEPNFAKKVAEVSLLKNWSESCRYVFSLVKKYSYLNVGDAILLNGKKLIIEDISFEKENAILFSGRSYDEVIYNLNLNQYERGGDITPEASVDDVITYILDLPCLPQNDYSSVKQHFAIASQGVFKGAEIFASSDNGVSYTKLATAGYESIIGTCVNTLSPANAYIFDDKNQPEILLITGELESKNELSILNGSNAALIGDEIIQFTSAEFVGQNQYKLKNLLRGRLGTEAKITGHVKYERFILLNSLLTELNVSEQIIGQTRKYKIVPAGKTLLEVAAIDFTFNGNSLKPYSPVKVTANIVSNNIIINWVRRTRSNGDIKNYVDAQLLESSEVYEVDILNLTNNIVRTIRTNTTTVTYTSAQQITDFGTNQTSLKANIYQLSEVVGRGHPAQLVMP